MFETSEFNPEEKLSIEFEKLQEIADALRSMGFEVVDELITIDSLRDPSSIAGFPIVRDGVDGIRASYDAREGLAVWFTNGYEDPNEPRRQEVLRRLNELNLI